jgi:hypothetical protein
MGHAASYGEPFLTAQQGVLDEFSRQSIWRVGDDCADARLRGSVMKEVNAARNVAADQSKPACRRAATYLVPAR